MTTSVGQILEPGRPVFSIEQDECGLTVVASWDGNVARLIINALWAAHFMECGAEDAATVEGATLPRVEDSHGSWILPPFDLQERSKPEQQPANTTDVTLAVGETPFGGFLVDLPAWGSRNGVASAVSDSDPDEPIALTSSEFVRFRRLADGALPGPIDMSRDGLAEQLEDLRRYFEQRDSWWLPGSVVDTVMVFNALAFDKRWSITLARWVDLDT